MTTRLVVIPFLVLALLSCRASLEPRREEGLGVLLVPKLSTQPGVPGKDRWGFLISVPGDRRPPAERPLVTSPAALLGFLAEQSRAVQFNGIWLIVTDPDAYTPTEKNMVVELKRLCNEKETALFVTRGSEFPYGFERVNED